MGGNRSVSADEPSSQKKPETAPDGADAAADVDALADEMIAKHAEALRILADHDAEPSSE